MKKGKSGQAAVIVLLILVLIAVVILIGLQLPNSFITGNVISGDKVVGSGKVITESFDFSDFDEIEILGRGNLFITQGNNYNVRIEAEDNIMGLLNPRVEGDKLVIGERRLLFYNEKPINIYVQMPEVEEIKISGSGDIKSQNKIREDVLNVEISGSGDVEMSLNVEELETGIAGSGDFYYEGKVKEHTVSISGSGKLRGFDLQTEKTSVKISGSGNAEIYATEELDIKIFGSGNVQYKGTPKLTQSISGTGKVESR